MTPDPRPFPRFIASSTQEGIPYGRFAERLRDVFAAAAEEIEDLPEGITIGDGISWFPERTWSGRTWVPTSVLSDSADGQIEIFGHVSYVPDPEGDPTDFKAVADFTDVLADENPDWRIDLNDDVVGLWRGEAGMCGDVTLVWGRSLVPGAVAATAEVEGICIDQEAVSDDRFTLIALDALKGYGDDLFMEVKLWNRRANELASESLYDDGVDEDDEDDEPENTEPKASSSE